MERFGGWTFSRVAIMSIKGKNPKSSLKFATVLSLSNEVMILKQLLISLKNVEKD